MTDLNRILLPPTLLVDLYKNSLVEINLPMPLQSPSTQTKKAGRHKPAEAIQYLGRHEKGICLLVDYPNDVHLPETQLGFLTSILQACKLNLGDVAIINCNRQPVTFAALAEQFSCRQLLLFGIATSSIGLPDFPLFTIHSEDSCEVLCAPPADNLNSAGAESKILKSKLWACLKQLFAV